MQKGPTRRRLVQRLAVGAVGSIAGCAAVLQSSQNGTQTGNTASTTDASARADDQSFTIALTSDPTTGKWDVYNGVTPEFTHIFEPLVGIFDKMDVKPLLAKRWETTGKKTWKFELREDVTFHNGETLTAEAVKYSFETLLESDFAGRGRTRLESGGITVVDEHTVEFETTGPFPSFPRTTAYDHFGIQHPNASKSGNVIGTGPFRLERAKDESVTVVPFKDHWRTDPRPSKLTFRPIVDPTTRTLALEKGAIDIAFDVPRSTAPSVEEAAETATRRQLSPRAGLAAVNLYKPPTDDEMFRDALNWAVDQKAIVEYVLNGIGEPARGPFSPVIPWAIHDKLRKYGSDREKAKRLVKRSDYNGQTLPLLVYRDNQDDKLIAEVLKGWFKKIGVSTNIRVVGSASFYETFTSVEVYLSFVNFGSYRASADALIRAMFHSLGIDNRKLYKSEGTGVYNPGKRVDQLIKKGFRACSLKKKRKYYGEVQHRVVETGAIVPLYYYVYVLGKRASVSGIEMYSINRQVGWSGLVWRE